MSDQAPPEAEAGEHKAQDGQAPAPAEEKPDQEAQEVKRDTSDVLGRLGKPGTIQDRLGAQQDAVRSFEQATVAARTVVGGDQHTYYFGEPQTRRAPVAPLRAGDIKEVDLAFVAPGDFDELLRQARDRRVVILRAPANQGRFAAARRLLIAPDRPLFVVNSTIKLDELAAADLTEGAGYVCPDFTRVHELNGFVLDHLLAVLDDPINARLVITIDDAQPVDDPRVAELVLNLGSVGDRREIVRKQLALRLGKAAVDGILGDPDVRKLVDDELGGIGPPRHARIVAQELFRAHQAGLPLARTAEQALKLRDGQQLASWFEQLDSLSLQCMAVATAVLAGEPYETVALAAMDLKGRLETEDPHLASRRRLDAPLRPTKQVWLRKLGLRTVPSTVKVRHGATAPTEVVRYLDQSAQGKVLLYFWSEFDEQRPELLDWLRHCADHQLESVRVRTAVATGMLARKGFDLVRAVVIEPWAREDDFRFRTVAAAALQVAAVQPGLRETVRELLQAWSKPAQPAVLRATAARAWRVEYDVGGAVAALDKLGEYAADEDLTVTDAVCDSLTELWETEWDLLDAPARLLKWMTDRPEARQITARLAFLVAALQLVLRQADDDFDWPGLLHIAARDATRMREIAGLWRDVLNDPLVQKDAADILFEWARMADKTPLVRRSLARLMQATAADALTAGRIRYAARSWAAGDRPAKTSSADILTALTSLKGR